MKKEGKAKKEKRVFTIRLTITSIILWSIVFLVIIGWSFLLGILAGAGFFSEDVELRKPVAHQKKDVEKGDEKIKLSYHKVLTSKPKRAIQIQDSCYSVQLVAYSKKIDAIKFIRKLKKYGYNAYYVKDKGYYKVRCGRLRGKKDAELLKEKLYKKLHLNGMIVRCE